MNAQSQSGDLAEVYLQISPNILESFPKFRPPVALYRFDPAVAQVKKYHDAEARLAKERQEEVAEFANEGTLFLLRDDYRVYAQHLSKNLGLVLTEEDFTPQEVAEIFFIALRDRMNEFLEQPTEEPLRGLAKDLSILVEYLWIDPVRVERLTSSLHTEYDLAGHSVNTMFVGLALFTMVVRGKYERATLVSLALGLILHDLGMANVPRFILDKPQKFLRSDRDSVENHIDAGVSKLNRLKLRDPLVMQCVTQHHERVDGSGYPNRIMREGLTMPGRLCGLADAFCAIASIRPHREAKDFKQAALLLLKDGERFDPTLAKLLAVLVTKGVSEYLNQAA
ncbi:HD domain-containing phosphohydrolase [Pseudodesulfovibrio sp.]|uniref:HD-GYP domain-containing protein n=1 Tax=Pseudodesulfovibrio sp. TaxID=2035812 RepID=UPI0026251833|nr:HD domain-containing phosphohydrolase [Pseudodesulfovibrio sp.]MDD3313605.1 HD domain-containing protein [Pseudodesulfovibrio sp.]